MKAVAFAIFIPLAVGLCLSCSRPDVKPPQTPASPLPVSPTASLPKDGNYSATGKVTKINLEIGSVELNHDDIPGVMPPMTMEFYVRDKTQLKPLKVGDEVNFVLEYKHPAETITDIKKKR